MANTWEFMRIFEDATEEKGVADFKILFKQSPEESKNNLKKNCHNSL